MPESSENKPVDKLTAGETGDAPKPGKRSRRAGKPTRPDKADAAKAPVKAPAKAPAKTPAKKRAPRRWPVVLAGTATVALAVGAIGAGTLFPGVNATAESTPSPHALPVGDTLANCQGPTQLLAGSAAGADPQFSANSSATKSLLNAVVLSNSGGDLPGTVVQALDTKFSSLLTIAAASANAPATDLAASPKARAAVVRGDAVGGSSVLRSKPFGQERSTASASVVVEANDGDLAGLAAATCQSPANELWLSGASTSVGRTAVLMVANSSPSPATLSLDLFGSTGPINAPGAKGLVVGPGGVRSVVLSGLAPDQELLSVHLKSAGGAVSAVIQQSVLRGLTPGGVDYLAPVQAPAPSATIAGVRVQAPEVAAKISAQNSYADASTELAVTVPGVADSVVEVKAFGESGQVALPNGGVFTAPAGKVSSLSLAGLPEGNYSLSVSADASVTAAVRLVNSTKPGEAVDMAVAPSTERLGDNHLLTVPAGVRSSLVFAAPQGAATVQLVPISIKGVVGKAKTVELKGGSTSVVVPGALFGTDMAALIVSASGAPAYGSHLLAKDSTAGIAVLPIPRTSAASNSINLTTGY
ncbi:DUF5719 family protein [Arthrobacter sp. TMN-49]